MAIVPSHLVTYSLSSSLEAELLLGWQLLPALHCNDSFTLSPQRGLSSLSLSGNLSIQRILRAQSLCSSHPWTLHSSLPSFADANNLPQHPPSTSTSLSSWSSFYNQPAFPSSSTPLSWSRSGSGIFSLAWSFSRNFHMHSFIVYPQICNSGVQILILEFRKLRLREVKCLAHLKPRTK